MDPHILSDPDVEDPDSFHHFQGFIKTFIEHVIEVGKTSKPLLLYHYYHYYHCIYRLSVDQRQLRPDWSQTYF